MAALVAAVVLLGVLCIVNAVFCLGIVRRLREHTELLNKMSSKGSDLLRPAGELVDDFETSTVDGRPVSRGSLAGPTLVAFFSPGCAPCKEELPKFVALAGAHPGGRAQVLAVLAGGDDSVATPMAATLADVAQVVREEESGPVQEAFDLRGYPAFAVLEQDGVIRVTENRVERLSAPIPA